MRRIQDLVYAARLTGYQFQKRLGQVIANSVVVICFGTRVVLIR